MVATIPNGAASVVGGSLVITGGTGARPGGTVGVYIDDVLASQRATADSSGIWSITVPNFGSGSHTVRAADLYDTLYNVTTTFVPANVTIGAPVGDVSTDNTPLVVGTVTNPNGGPVAGLTVNVYYRVAGTTAWKLDPGPAITDSSGAYTHDFVTVLPDGDVEFKAEAAPLTIQSNPVTIKIDKANEAPVMPPSHTAWVDAKNEPNRAEGKWGYLGSMVVGIGAPNGFPIGRVLPLNIPKPAPSCSISGDTDGLAVDPATGMISVADATKITTAGLRYVSISWSNVAGSAQITVPIEVVAAVSANKFFDAANGSDANDGRLPHTAKKTISAVGTLNGRVFLKFGDTYTDQIVAQSNTVYRAWGDPALTPPQIDTDAAFGLVPTTTGGNPSNITVQDIWFSAAQRCLNFQNNANVSLHRIYANGNTVKSNNSQAIYGHGCSNFRAFHCKTESVFGDGLYLRKVAVAEIGWSDFGVPISGGSDCVQITWEGDSTFMCRDVYFHDSICRQSSTAGALKGSLVIEGCTRYLVERCILYGKYFAFSNQGDNGTVRDNIALGSRFPATNAEAWGIGCGGRRAIAHDQQIYDNIIDDCRNGLLSSGYDDNDTLQRYDFEYTYNTVKRCSLFMKQSRATSGVVKFNIGYANSSNTVQRSNAGLTVATGGDFTTYDATGNTFQSVEGPVCSDAALPVVAGEVREGQILTVSNIGTWSGAPVSYEYVWRINGRRIADAPNAASFTVPTGLAAQVNPFLPSSLRKAEISCLVIATDANGRKGMKAAKFATPSSVANQNVKYAAVAA